MPAIMMRGALSASAFGFGLNISTVSAVYVEDVFVPYLYTGTGSSLTITTNIDLSTNGGMIWVKNRNSTSFGDTSHYLQDTTRGITYSLSSNDANAQFNQTTGGVTAVSTTGFTVGTYPGWNDNTYKYVAWTFKEQQKFFDVVQYTGNSTNRTIAHNLGATPGMIIVKCISSSTDWYVYHTSLTSPAYYLTLNTYDAQNSDASAWNSTAPTSSVFSLGTNGAVNGSGQTFIAYLFAQSGSGGFGLGGTDSIIACGSYTGNGSTSGPSITLGWEPQWILVKDANNTNRNWVMLDVMRGMSNSNAVTLLANFNSSESSYAASFISPTATGFQLNTNVSSVNASGGNYIYVAIRRGPMKVPTDATKVFAPILSSAAAGTKITTGFTVDMQLQEYTLSPSGNVLDRLRGISSTSTASGKYLQTTTAGAEFSSGLTQGWDNTGFQITASFAGAPTAYWNFARAPGFFDVVCYGPGTGGSMTVAHNLTVVPELLILKCRSASGQWLVQYGTTSYGFLSFDAAFSAGTITTALTSTSFTLSVDTNTYVAYLFATCAGVSKVGTYTGTGTTKQVNCGFTAGSRYVLIKRMDDVGDWYVWDSARGIVAGNDPYLLLNSTAAEVTGTDYVDTYSAGFEISSTAPAAINANGGTYLFLAIA